MKFICEVKNVGECDYVIEFVNESNGEVLESVHENSLDDCLIDLYNVERSCYDTYCNVNDEVKIKIDNVLFGL